MQADGSTSSFKSGFAMSDMTPPVPFPLAGYITKEERMCSGVRDPLTARALVLEDGKTRVALVSVDLVVVPRSLQESVNHTLLQQGVMLDGCVLAATHTHSGPGGYWDVPSAEPFMGRFRQEIFDRLTESIAEAVKQAACDLKPTNVSWGAVRTSEGTSFNRRNRKLPVDPFLSLLILQQPRVTIRAIFFGAHPVVVAEHEKELASACFPGELLRSLESGEDRALFFNGAAGATSILWPEKIHMEEHLKRITQSLEKAVEEAERAASPLRGPSLRQADISFPVRVKMPRLFPSALLPFEALFLPLRWKLKRFGQKGLIQEDSAAVVKLLCVGDAIVAGFPADIGPGVGLAARELIRSEGFQTLGVLSYCSDYFGYVHMPEDYKAFPEWTSDGLFLTVYENAMGFAGRQMGRDFLEALEKGIRKIKGQEAEGL